MLEVLYVDQFIKGGGLRTTLLLAILVAALLSLLYPVYDAGSGHMSAAADGEMHFWVFFNDKGESRGLVKSVMLDEADMQLLPRARARREKAMRGAIVDYRDVAVHDAYISEVTELGAVLRHRSRWFNAVSVAASEEKIREISRLPFVLKVEPVKKLARSGDRPFQSGQELKAYGTGEPFHFHSAQADTAFYGNAFYQLDEIGVPAAHDSGYTGAGVLVGMFDTGYYKVHEALRELPIIAEWDFVFEDGETQNEAGDVEGQHNHGTSTWSALGGYAPNTLIGPAYGASFFLAKTEDLASETPAEEDNYVAALEWSDSLGVSVVSVSLAYKEFDDPQYNYTYEDLDGNTATITVAVDIAASRGILVANANSNNGPSPGSLWTPADADSMLACGAVDEFNQVAGFSSRGPTFDGRIKPEVVARGVDTFCARASSPNSYGNSGGTSLSTPLVGGAAAVVWEAHPEWNAMDVRDALMQTADNASTPDNDRGWGRINVHSAIYDITPPIYPVPFSLTTPEDGEFVSTNEILFAWNPSRDPDTSSPVSYTLLISRDEQMNEILWEVGSSDTLSSVIIVIPPADSTFFWTVLAVDEALLERQAREIRELNIGEPSGAGEDEGKLPRTWSGLLQNYPNPFNPSTTISFSVAGEEGKQVNVRLKVYDIRGRLVRDLIDSEMEPGFHRVGWDGRDETGNRLGSGVYLYRLEVENIHVTRKMNLLK